MSGLAAVSGRCWLRHALSEIGHRLSVSGRPV